MCVHQKVIFEYLFIMFLGSIKLSSKLISSFRSTFIGMTTLRDKDTIAYGVATKFLRTIVVPLLDESQQLAEANRLKIDFAAVQRSR